MFRRISNVWHETWGIFWLEIANDFLTDGCRLMCTTQIGTTCHKVGKLYLAMGDFIYAIAKWHLERIKQEVSHE